MGRAARVTLDRMRLRRVWGRVTRCVRRAVPTTTLVVTGVLQGRRTRASSDACRGSTFENSEYSASACSVDSDTVCAACTMCGDTQYARVEWEW